MAEISTYNSKFSYGTTEASMTEVKVKTFPEVAAKRSSIDVTDLSDAAKRYIPGIRETPESLDFEANYDKTVYDTIEKLKDNNEIYQKLTLSDGSSWSWQGGLSVALSAGKVNEAVQMVISAIPATVPVFDSGTGA